MSKLVVYLLDVGCGSMSLILFPNGRTYLYDCNLTDDNEDVVLEQLGSAMGPRRCIDVFICSHRDCDHMRGLRVVHRAFPISTVRDAGVEGTSCDAGEYRDYMALRRDIGFQVIRSKTYRDEGSAKVHWIHAASDSLSDANDQSVVMRIEYGANSVIFAGDTSFRAWKRQILSSYSAQELKSDILVASHHGSITFFDDPSTDYYFTEHVRKIAPDMTLISVGDNVWGLPNKKAIELYEKYSDGSNLGVKVRRTDVDGNLRLTLDGGWKLTRGL